MTARTHLTSTFLRNTIEIAVQDIVFFQSSHKYVDAYMADGTSHILDDSKLNTVKALLDEYGDQFMMVHRSCLVRRSEIKSMRRVDNEFTLVLKSDVRVLVSRRHAPAVRKVVNDYREELKESVQNEQVY